VKSWNVDELPLHSAHTAVTFRTQDNSFYLAQNR